MTYEQYGPQTQQIEHLLYRLTTLDNFQKALLASQWRANETQPGTMQSRVNTWNASALFGREDIRQVVFNHIDYDMWPEAWEAAADSAEALMARDLISEAEYITLTTPARHVLGQLHPHD
jgi:hypothetical protein